MQAQQRRHVETVAFAVAIVVAAQGVQPGYVRTVDDRWRGYFIRTDIVAEQIGPGGNAQLERADVAQEAIQVLRTNRLAKQCGWADLGGNFSGGGRRSEVLYADGPVKAAVTIRTTGAEEQPAALVDVGN